MKKPLAALIIEKIKAKDSPKSDNPSVNDSSMDMQDSEDSNVACEMAVEEFAMALSKKNFKAASKALMDFLALCEDAEDEE